VIYAKFVKNFIRSRTVKRFLYRKIATIIALLLLFWCVVNIENQGLFNFLKTVYTSLSTTLHTIIATTHENQNLILCEVLRIIDGDTFVAEVNGTEEKIRLIGIDTPEYTTEKEPFGKEATDYTTKILEGKKVYLEKDAGERDKYGRLLMYVWLEIPDNFSEEDISSKMLNAILLKEGLAVTYTVPPNVRYRDIFLAIQEEAK